MNTLLSAVKTGNCFHREREKNVNMNKTIKTTSFRICLSALLTSTRPKVESFLY